MQMEPLKSLILLRILNALKLILHRMPVLYLKQIECLFG